LHEIAAHPSTVRCLPAAWVYQFALDGPEPFVALRLPAHASVGEARIALADHLRLPPRQLAVFADGAELSEGALMAALVPGTCELSVHRRTTEVFRIRPSEGAPFEVELPFGTKDCGALTGLCRARFPSRRFGFWVAGLPLDRLPRPDRATIELRFEDLPLTFAVGGGSARLIVPRTATFEILRRRFAGKRVNTAEFVAFSVSGDPLPLGRLAGSLEPGTAVTLERLGSEEFKVEGQAFAAYSTAGEVRARLRTPPERRLLLSDARGILPNSALLLRAPQVRPIDATAPFSVALAGDFPASANDRRWNATDTADELFKWIAQTAAERRERVQLSVGRLELRPDDLLCELSGATVTVKFGRPPPRPGVVYVERADGLLEARECADPAAVHIGDLGRGSVAIDGRVFPPERTLAAVGWSPQSVIFAAPPLDVRALFDGACHPPPEWAVVNADRSGDSITVTGPTVGDALAQIEARAAERKSPAGPTKRKFGLRTTTGPIFTDGAQPLVPGDSLVLIDSADAEAWAVKSWWKEGLSNSIPDMTFAEFMSRLQVLDFDTRAFRTELRARYPGVP
jgi:hypothetical protein